MGGGTAGVRAAATAAFRGRAPVAASGSGSAVELLGQRAALADQHHARNRLQQRRATSADIRSARST